MPERWPPLDQYEVKDSPSLVQKLLRTLPGDGFESHLISRRVEKIKIGFFLFRAVLSGTTNEQGFNIGLSAHHGCFIEDWMIGIGHELGHTFAYGIELTPPLRRQQQWGELSEWGSSNRLRESEEEFCDLFGAAWADSCDGHPELERLLGKLKGKPGTIHIQF